MSKKDVVIPRTIKERAGAIVALAEAVNEAVSRCGGRQIVIGSVVYFSDCSVRLNFLFPDVGRLIAFRLLIECWEWAECIFDGMFLRVHIR